MTGANPARDAVELLRSLAIGTRVVVRYRLDDGRATDALGYMSSVEDNEVVVQTKRGGMVIGLAYVIAAKRVPPPPESRQRGAKQTEGTAG